MKKLQKKTIKLFLLTLIALYLITAISDGIIEYFIENYAQNSGQVLTLVGLGLFLSISYLALAAFYFSKKLQTYFSKEIP